MQEKVGIHSDTVLCIITGCGGGEWPPLLALAEGLRRRGHQLVVVCDHSTIEAVESAGLHSLCLPPELSLEIFFEPAIAELFFKQEEDFLQIDNPLIKWGQSAAEYVKNSLVDWRPSLIITSLFALGLGDILSESLSASRCFLNPSFNFCHSHEQLRGSDFSKKGRLMYEHWLLPLAKKADLVLHATDSVFDNGFEPCPPFHKYVGPLFWEKPGNLSEVLQEPGVPWVLVTLSTSPQPGDLTIVKTALKALASKNVRVLVTMAPDHNEAELGQLSQDVQIAGYIPHSKILPLCSLVVSHAGHGIVMKAMAHGVPMVLVPWGRDQPGVAARAKQLGIAEVVCKEKCSVANLKVAIDKVFGKTDFQRSLKLHSDRVNSIDGATSAVNHIEQLIGNS